LGALKVRSVPGRCPCRNSVPDSPIQSVAARMKVVAVPFPEDLADARFSLAALRLSSLEQLSGSVWDFFPVALTAAHSLSRGGEFW